MAQFIHTCSCYDRGNDKQTGPSTDQYNGWFVCNPLPKRGRKRRSEGTKLKNIKKYL
jgi:hypothetical protein